ncbi:DUF1287 domain-containing protein [Rubritalea spongiae]|uniref:DUF1287 domain-containing protein n=1 Tax=Rubritalea spongiae TaxID=430797 RepID=A0ABW5E1S7_9BACT
MRLEFLKFIGIVYVVLACVACGEKTGVRTELEVSGKPRQLIEAASWQIGKTRIYDPAYVVLEYPMGDIPMEKGVCTDVVIRAMRKAWGMDLQQLLHEDMKANFAQYPQRWGLKRPDKNIDHRRVPNMRAYFKRRGWSVAVSQDAADYLPGDLVTCTVAGRLPHIMVVSNTVNADGVPLVIHNIGAGTQLEDCLLAYPLTGHYRVK